MANIEDYRSGRILISIRIAHLALGFSGVPVIGPGISRGLEQRMEPFGVRPVPVDEALALVGSANRYATGPRTCQTIFPDTGKSGSVFLDELADAMVGAGKAWMIIKEEAAEFSGCIPAIRLSSRKSPGDILRSAAQTPVHAFTGR